MNTQTSESQAALTPDTCLDLLRDGNKRFVSKSGVDRDLMAQVQATAGGQYPFAAVLSCVDSRVSAELVLDQGIGDIFSARVAGNVLNEDILGSLEFACKVAGAKLIVVLGHSSCGAVKGACAGVEMGHLTGLLQKIGPSIEQVRQSGVDDGQLVDQVAQRNVDNVVREICDRSAVLNEMANEGSIALVGGMYSVATGEVAFSKPYRGSASATLDSTRQA